MSVSTPLVFRPNLPQRTIAALLCAGSWIVGLRTLTLLLQNLPRLHWALKQAQASGEPTTMLWVTFGSALAACLVAGLVLLLSVLVLVLVEGSQVLVDELGIAVDLGGLPGFLTRRLGAGRLVWKDINHIGKRHLFFVIEGGGGPEEAPLRMPGATPRLRFLVVDELERLVLLIIERSPNLHFKE